MKWIYYKENICTDRAVAEFCNEFDKLIFYVYEDRYGYFTRPVSKHINSIHLEYFKARKLNTKEEENDKDTTNVLFSSLKHACEYFEKDYYKQVEKIKKEFFNN